jgi:hypothetical protein
MKRREFITLLGGATVTWPCLVLAESARKAVPRIGVRANRYVQNRPAVNRAGCLGEPETAGTRLPAALSQKEFS